jgi:hypothetical protein
MARSVSNDKFVAFIEKGASDCAFVTVHPRPADDRYGINFQQTVSCYETLSRGATASARREIRRLAAAASERVTA